MNCFHCKLDTAFCGPLRSGLCWPCCDKMRSAAIDELDKERRAHLRSVQEEREIWMTAAKERDAALTRATAAEAALMVFREGHSPEWWLSSMPEKIAIAALASTPEFVAERYVITADGKMRVERPLASTAGTGWLSPEEAEKLRSELSDSVEARVVALMGFVQQVQEAKTRNDSLQADAAAMRSALLKVTDESKEGDILCDDRFTMSFHKNSPLHKEMLAALSPDAGRELLAELERSRKRVSELGPLVPVEEVERAFAEGFLEGDMGDHSAEKSWNDSRAKRVTEGGE